ncbi:MAG: exodeoxyribonuclease VII large subunit [Clostridia bacterium]|nr:exodeoxyribonuclease VII large subunit [Clostridia bacterium]
MEQRNALSVTQLNKYVKTLMQSDDFLSSICVSGEISNFKRHSSGHLYFTLKDEQSEISAVMFRASASGLSFLPSNGMKVTVFGSVTVYEAAGRYQIYVGAMTNDGAGALYEQYKRLYEKLKAEGLFDEQRKKPIPKFPNRIGIITSPTGAAVRDMINVTGRRYPLAEILLCPALVQGAEAPLDLCRALALLDTMGECDVIIIGRGGGSIEDLWAFNDEGLVRAVASASTPIISAVGHETDTTLCDYVADMRAPTPSAAAEQAVPDKRELLQILDNRSEMLDTLQCRILARYRDKIASKERQISVLSPDAKIRMTRDNIVRSSNLLEAKMNALTENRRLRLTSAISRLESVNPLAVIKRGYGMTFDGEGKIVTRVNDVNEGDRISVLVSDGYLNARVESKKSKADT